MSLSDLATAIVNIEFLIDEQRGIFRERGFDAEAMLQLSSNYRRLGCGRMLIDLDADALANNLYLSGVVYRELLRARKAHRLDDYYLTSSFGWPLIDATAAGADRLVAEITELMPRTLMSDQGEDPEDFAYFQLFMTLAIAPPAIPSLVTSQLGAYADTLLGESPPRFGVMNAIVNGDPVAFAEYFPALLRDWKTDINERRKAGRIDPYDDLTTANVFIEGLALVQLAKRRGIEPSVEYPRVPEQAITLVHNTFPPDATALG